jgi:inorganic phosphate transporter, PiT family
MPLWFVVFLAYLFEFANGWTDAPNSIATVVSTRVLRPLQAVGMAAVLNLVGALAGTKVAETVGTDVVDAQFLTLETIAAVLVAATIWALGAQYYGLPSSESHALIAGLLGAGFAAGGLDALLSEGPRKTAIGLVSSPVGGFLAALLIMVAIYWIFAKLRPSFVRKLFGRAQIASAGFMAFSHGTNDAQKTMGIIALALVATGHLSAEEFEVPLWVIVSAATAMALGTYAGGWRIIRTLGQRVAKLEPPQGFAAETATATILWFTGTIGFPVSTTHTISGSVLGAGAIRGFSAVRWGVAGNIVVAWLLTLPMAALIGAAAQLLTRIPGGTLIVFLLMAAIAAFAFAARTWQTRKLAPAAA